MDIWELRLWQLEYCGTSMSSMGIDKAHKDIYNYLLKEAE
jgi:hypothetical protein